MVRIEDGGGKNGNVTVSNNQRLDTSARAASRQYYESRDTGQVYTVISVDATAVANEETIYVQNTSTSKDMIIEKITISADVDSQWRVKFVTGTADGGSVITPVNLNKASSNTAAATCRGNGAIGSITDDGDITIVRIGADGHDEVRFSEALRLGQDDAIAVECELNCACEIVVSFHFDSE